MDVLNSHVNLSLAPLLARQLWAGASIEFSSTAVKQKALFGFQASTDGSAEAEAPRECAGHRFEVRLLRLIAFFNRFSSIFMF